jgi:hypothetical protein
MRSMGPATHATAATLARVTPPTPHGPSARRRLDPRIVLGIVASALWVSLALAYVSLSVGWRAFVGQPPSEFGSFLEGVVAPLAFLWLVLGLFLQQSELAANSEALRVQSEALRKSAEQAEIQARAIQANELHARQDTFVDLARLVTRQLGVICGFLFMSSQGAIQGGAVPGERIRELWDQVGSGDDQAFMRALLGLRAALDEREGFDLFYGTPVRTRHCDAYVRAFERLLRAAEGCDPDGMIRDAILGDAAGRIYRLLSELRASPPADARVVEAQPA